MSGDTTARLHTVPAGATGKRLLTRAFAHGDIGDLRRAVSRCAGSAGLAGPVLEDFVLAVNELVTNAVRHGGGTGRLTLWRAGGELVCEVSDQGGGIGDATATGHRRPQPSVVGGWGLWLARHLSQTMAVTTGTTGTAIRISTALPPARPDAPPSGQGGVS